MEQINQTTTAIKLSLLSIILTVIFASITHFYEFGYRAFIVGLVFMFILYVLNTQYQRAKNNVLLVAYLLINVFLIIGFGLVNGFWNHTFKVFISFLHGGELPPFLAQLFLSPQTGSAFYESVGALTFFASMFAAYYGYKLISQKHNSDTGIIQ